MAENNIRKSSRIKTRKRTSYLEDDFEFDYDIHLDISSDISNILESHTKQKSRDGYGKSRKSFPNVAKNIATKEKPNLSGDQNVADDVDHFNVSKKKATATDEGSKGDGDITNFIDDSQVTCPICKEVLTSNEQMEEHMTIHEEKGEKPKGRHICDICERVCVDEAAYNRHMKSHDTSRKYRCDICDKAFAESCSLKRHMKTHDDDRPFTCDLCFKSFRDTPSLVRHQKTHTDRPRIYSCLKCDKTFADKHGLKRHERIHTGLRPFECNICFRTFSESGSFKRHQKIHTGIRNHVCQICKKSFLEKQSLLRHQKHVCGFGDGVLEGSASFPSSVDREQSRDSVYSAANNSEISHTSFEDANSSNVNDYSVASDSIVTADSESSTVHRSSSFVSPSANRNKVNMNNSSESKDLVKGPSLQSLIKKDPNLYDSISEIVESIDSYEKMLDLCGESGQKEIDAALKKEPVPMPDNLLCFECGEPLVDGENFKSEGKTFHPNSNNSYKCLNCDEIDEDYGDPPVLTAEIPVNESSPQSENGGTLNAEQQNKDDSEENRNSSVEENSNISKTVFGTDETIEHLRERLKTQHGVYFFGDSYGSGGEEDDSDTNDQTDVASSNATASRSNSTDSDVRQMTQALMMRQILAMNSAKIDFNAKTPETVENPSQDKSDVSKDQVDNVLSPTRETASTSGAEQGIWVPPTPKLEYEADDPNIPSVFPCHLCTKVFATSAFLAQHLELHRKSPHKCMVCFKTFTNAPGLKRHMTTHTGEKPYSCPNCHKHFRDPSNCSKHKKLCKATRSAPSPGGSVSPTSSVSSPRSTDDSNLTAHTPDVGAYKADLKQKLNFPPPTSSSTPISHSAPLKFSYDNDEEEDLPVRFDQTTDSAEPQMHLPKKQCKKRKNKKLPAKTDKPPANIIKSIVKEEEDEEDSGVMITCPVCEKTCGSKTHLSMHMNYHSGDPEVTCIECGKIFADRFGLKRHMRIHSGIRPHVCDYCNRGYCDNWSLRKHHSRGCVMQEVQVPVDFLHPCPQCNRVFGEVEYLNEHMKTHTGLLKFECDICQKKFSEAFNLKRHRRLHMAICTGCDREFRDIQSLHDHQANECPVNIPDTAGNRGEGFSCPECGRVYSTKAYLERHKKFHSDLKPYTCEICSKKFSEAFRLRRHMRVHTASKPHTCGECGKGFTEPASLKRHITSSACNAYKEQQLRLQQLEQQEFPCHLCDRVFAKNYLLVRHMNVHSQDRPFSCDICGRSYKDASSLKRHQLIHQGVREFICPVCGKDFYYPDSLRRHMSASCGNNSRSRRRGRGGRRKSTNNLDMQNNNAVKEAFTPRKSVRRKMTSNEVKSDVPVTVTKKICPLRVPARNVTVSHWSCHNRKHCWRCNIKFKTAVTFLCHARIHQHKRPYHCKHCFLRWSKKPFYRVHIRSHKMEPESMHQLQEPVVTPFQPLVPTEETKRPRRSIPRTRWSWISKI